MDKVIIAASTHWDREWYRTFSEFRIRLCDMMNNLLDLLEKDDDFVCYTFDGQSVVLDDYLEVFPQNRQRVQKLVQQGKLAFGPLYNLPDEFLSGGEALIRNFLAGDQVCKDIGGKMNAGYIPDNFGHISQMPQILNQVGIDSAFFFRGANMHAVRHKEFFWQSPDGSRVLGEYLLLGYWSLKSWGKMGESVCDHFKDVYQTLKGHSALNTILMINGSDHLYQDPDFTSNLKQVQQASSELDICNASIEAYAKLAKEAVTNRNLHTIYEELRDFRYGPDPTSATSCRSYLKKELYACLTELERYSEPLCSMLYQMGEVYPAALIDHSWKQVLKALGHDGITGCSTDLVIQDIRSYITHAHQTASRLSELSLEKLSKKIDTSKLNKGEQFLTLFNPLAERYSGIAEQTVHIENSQDAVDLLLYDDNRNPVEYELLDCWEDVITREFLYESKERITRKCFRIRFYADQIPSMGIRSYIAVPSKRREKRQAELFVRLQNSSQVLENEHFTITVNSDASINVTEKATGKTHANLNTLVSRGEIGDEYQHVSPLWDKHIFAAVTSIAVEKNSQFASSLIIRAKMVLPVQADSKLLGRGAQTIDCPITIRVTLYQNSKRVEFETEFENNASDHILYAVFPTSFTEQDYSYVSFDRVHRSNEIYSFDPDLKSTQSVLKPMQHYAGIGDDARSLNVLGKGLYEYHTKPSGKGTDLYITLLRSTSYLFYGLPVSWQDGQHSTTPIVKTHDSKELGACSFAYALYFDCKTLHRESERYRLPLRGLDVPKQKSQPTISKTYSFLSLESDQVYISAVKKHRNGSGIVVRLYNMQDTVQNVTLHTGFTISECSLCNLLEQPQEPLEHTENAMTLSVQPKKIISLIVNWS